MGQPVAECPFFAKAGLPRGQDISVKASRLRSESTQTPHMGPWRIEVVTLFTCPRRSWVGNEKLEASLHPLVGKQDSAWDTGEGEWREW